MDLKEVVCSNVRKCLDAQGISYSQLTRLSNGKISSHYINALRHNKADLSLSKLEMIAKVLNVDVNDLLDTNLEYKRTDCALAHQFKTRKVLLNDDQYSTAISWEVQNRKRINEARYYQYFKLKILSTSQYRGRLSCKFIYLSLIFTEAGKVL